mmetsp:Transcript_16377/g.41800  ORF Transcript_16377/g.41800 Transcript_16377/m.41800 type:complete len:272 (-) Transcript_16377:152-967(-)
MLKNTILDTSGGGAIIITTIIVLVNHIIISGGGGRRRRNLQRTLTLIFATPALSTKKFVTSLLQHIAIQSNLLRTHRISWTELRLFLEDDRRFEVYVIALVQCLRVICHLLIDVVVVVAVVVVVVVEVVVVVVVANHCRLWQNHILDTTVVNAECGATGKHGFVGMEDWWSRSSSSLRLHHHILRIVVLKQTAAAATADVTAAAVVHGRVVVVFALLEESVLLLHHELMQIGGEQSLLLGVHTVFVFVFVVGVVVGSISTDGFSQRLRRGA